MESLRALKKSGNQNCYQGSPHWGNVKILLENSAPYRFFVWPPVRLLLFQRVGSNLLYFNDDPEFPDRKDLEMTISLKKGIR